jgi:hypothetical protein
MQDRLFLLSLDEYNKYVAGNRKYTKIRVPLIHKRGILGRIARRLRNLSMGESEFIYDCWMLRVYNRPRNYLAVKSNGKIEEWHSEIPALIRPAMKINMNSLTTCLYLNKSVRRKFHNGSVIKIGELYGKPIEWYVLDEKEGLVLSKYPLCYCEECQMSTQKRKDEIQQETYQDVIKKHSEDIEILGLNRRENTFIPFDVDDVDVPEKDDSYQYSLVRFYLQMIFMTAIEPKEKILIDDVKLYENEDIKLIVK